MNTLLDDLRRVLDGSIRLKRKVEYSAFRMFSGVEAKMPLKPFYGADPSQILAAFERDSSTEIASVQFRAEVNSIHSLDERDQWTRLQLILGCEPVYSALRISSLPVKIPARFYYARGLETIGTLANLLMRGGIHENFVDGFESALRLARGFLDDAVLRSYDTVEAYSCHDSWCEWFIGEQILDETVLVGNRGDWWLLAVSGTD